MSNDSGRGLGVDPCEADLAGDVYAVEQQSSPVKTPGDSLETGVLGGAGEQADDVGDDAGDACEHAVSQFDPNAAAFR